MVICNPQAQKSAAEIEREQEALLAKKYGGLAKKKLMPKVRPRLCCAVRGVCRQRFCRRHDHMPRQNLQHMPPAIYYACLQERNYFDSADWALSKQGKKPENVAGAAPGPPPTALPPKLEPNSVPDALRPRRSSHLGESEESGHL